MKKGWVATIGGILAALGTLPTLATNLHLDLPLWWNSCTAFLNLCGLLGLGVMGYVAKGADDHSTQEQIAASSIKRQADVLVKTADAAPTSVAEVEVVNTPALEVVNTPALKSKPVVTKPPAKPKV